MTPDHVRILALCLAPVATGCAHESLPSSEARQQITIERRDSSRHPGEERTVIIQYLEIVTTKVDETCDALAKAHGVTFGEPVAGLGNARTTRLSDGGRIGVRAPLRETEGPVVRPYVLVKDIEASVRAAEAAGARIAVPPMQIPGEGTFTIYLLGGIEHGLWQR